MKVPTPGPGEAIRALRKRIGLTLTELSGRTGLAVSTLSKLEMGHVSLSYDKLMLISKGLDVDMAELLDTTPHPNGAATHGGRRVVQRAGEGQHVETRSYSQVYLATELLNKRLTPIFCELHARTLDDFFAEFAAPAFDSCDVKDWMKRVSRAQDELGRHIDVVRAGERFAAMAPSDPGAWFAVGWLRAQQERSARASRKSLEHLRRSTGFWVRTDA